MKNLIFCALLLVGMGAVAAQEAPATKLFPRKQVVAPFRVEVSHTKTTHILFPAEVRYIDLGSPDIIAGKAAGAGNVVRVKATAKGFEGETNFSVITADGNFYSFDTRYAEQPAQLSIELDEWLRSGVFEQMNPAEVERIMQDIYRRNRRDTRLSSRSFGIRLAVRGIYIHGGVIYLYTALTNPSNIALDIALIRFKIVDKKVARRTAIQETTIEPLRVFNDMRAVRGGGSARHVFAFEKFTIPNDKVLVLEILERGGGRHQTIEIDNNHLLNAKRVK